MLKKSKMPCQSQSQKNGFRSRTTSFVAIIVLVVFFSDQPGCRANDGPLKLVWRQQLQLHSPTNVIVSQHKGIVRLAVQGTVINKRTAGTFWQSAAIEVLDSNGELMWRHIHKHQADTLPGAYIHWVSERTGTEPTLVYSYVPREKSLPGGVVFLRADDGHPLNTLTNKSHFGNNNSIVADLNNDGWTDFVYADQSSLTCFTFAKLEQSWQWDKGIRFCWSLPAVINSVNNTATNKSTPLIVFGSEYNNDDHSSSVICLDHNGQQAWRTDGFAEDLGSTPVFFADVDGNGTVEVLKMGLDLEHRQNQTWNHLHIFDIDGNHVRNVESGSTGVALGDMNGDGHFNGVGISNTRDGGHNGKKQIRCFDLDTGKTVWATSVNRTYLDCNSPVMANFSGDGQAEAVVGTGNPAGYARLPNSQPWGDLYLVNQLGNVQQHLELPGWPVNTAFCDFDNDGRNELLVVIDGKPGWLAVYKTRAPATQNDWPTPFGNAQRTGTMFQATATVKSE